MSGGWSARVAPRLRSELAADLESTARHLESLIPRAAAVGMADGIPAQVAEHLAFAQYAADADLFWVAGDMARLALDASLDVPGFTAEGLPTSDGLMLFGEPLPDLQTPPLYLRGGVPWRGTVPVWGLWWHPRDERTLRVQVITLSSALPRPMLRGSGPLQTVFAVVAPRDRGVVFEDIGRAVFAEDGTEMPLTTLGVLAFLSSAAHLMGMPSIAERRELDARTGREVRATTRPADVVRVIDLRPLRYERADSDASGRVYRHRWMVRGHWAHQPYGPGRAYRKMIYREPYIKGPEGAPLLTSDVVYTWRR